MDIQEQKKHVLPLNSSSFKQSVSVTFALSSEQLNALLEQLESKKTEFSDKLIVETLKCPISIADFVRVMLVYLTNTLISNPEKAKQISEELERLVGEKEKEKVDLLMNKIGNFSKDVGEACKYLIEIENYCKFIPHLIGHGYEFDHSFTGHKAGEGLMFPLVRLTLFSKSHKEEKETSLTFDANGFESFIISLGEALDEMKKETAIVKKSLGDKYTVMI